MTLKEIMVLNRGIDNKKIVGLQDGSPLNIAKDKELILEEKRKLIQKEILETYNKFTLKGAQIFSRMVEYKKAQKYICIQDMWIGIIDAKKSVIIQKKKKDSYRFETISTDSIEGYLKEKYSFLTKKQQIASPVPSAPEEKQLSARELYQMYFLEAKEGFLFESVEKKEYKSPRNRQGVLYFNHQNKEYRYDIQSSRLKQVSGEQIQIEIQNKLRLEN